MRKGYFASFEGGEGAGKSSQIRRTTEWLRRLGHDVYQTREPGGSPSAEVLRDLVVKGDADRWLPMTELLLFTAARYEHLNRFVLPRLADGAIVLSDRFLDSTIAYQGLGKNLPIDLIDGLHAQINGNVHPDLTVVLDIDPEIGVKRSLDRQGPGGETRFEGLDLSFHQRVRACFLERAQLYPARYAVIDASRSPDEVFADIQQAFTTRLAARLLAA